MIIVKFCLFYICCGCILLLIVFVVVIVVIVVWFVCKFVVLVLVIMLVSCGDIEQMVEVIGVVDVYKLVSVGVQVFGQIKLLKVQLGDIVKEGQLIVEIDVIMQQNQVFNVEVVLDNICVQCVVQQVSLCEVELEFVCQQQMFVVEVILCVEYDVADVRLKIVCVQIQFYDVQIKGCEIELGIVCVNLVYICIIVLMDGIVVVVVVEEGCIVNVNQIVFIIVMFVCLDLVMVNVEIFEVDVVKIKVGMLVYFIMLGELDCKYYVMLCQINLVLFFIVSDNVLSFSFFSFSLSMVVYYNVLFDVENFDGMLCIDMIVQVLVMFKQVKGVFMILVVVFGLKICDGQYMVCVVDVDGMLVLCKVWIGINNGVNVEVLFGLIEGEKVIVGEGGVVVGGSSGGGCGGLQIWMGGLGMGGLC